MSSLCIAAPFPQKKSEKGPLHLFFLRGGGGCTQDFCSGLPAVYQDLSMRHDWPVQKTIVDLLIKMKGNSKCTSSNLFSLFGPRTRISVLLRRSY